MQKENIWIYSYLSLIPNATVTLMSIYDTIISASDSGRATSKTFWSWYVPFATRKRKKIVHLTNWKVLFFPLFREKQQLSSREFTKYASKCKVHKMQRQIEVKNTVKKHTGPACQPLNDMIFHCPSMLRLVEWSNYSFKRHLKNSYVYFGN